MEPDDRPSRKTLLLGVLGMPLMIAGIGLAGGTAVAWLTGAF